MSYEEDREDNAVRERDALWQGDELDEMAEEVEAYLDSLPRCCEAPRHFEMEQLRKAIARREQDEFLVRALRRNGVL